MPFVPCRWRCLATAEWVAAKLVYGAPEALTAEVRALKPRLTQSPESYSSLKTYLQQLAAVFSSWSKRALAATLRSRQPSLSDVTCLSCRLVQGVTVQQYLSSRHGHHVIENKEAKTLTTATQLLDVSLACPCNQLADTCLYTKRCCKLRHEFTKGCCHADTESPA